MGPGGLCRNSHRLRGEPGALTYNYPYKSAHSHTEVNSLIKETTVTRLEYLKGQTPLNF